MLRHFAIKLSLFAVAVFLLLHVTMATAQQPPITQTIRLEAYIDAYSKLTIRGVTAQWFNELGAAPGRWSGSDEPTRIDGFDWYPVWPDLPDPENRNCDCLSDTYAEISPALPAYEFSVVLRPIQYRVSPELVESPSSANGYAIGIQFSDLN